MRTLAAIRTHAWGEDAQRLHARLAPVFEGDLAVVFHNRPEGLTLPSRVVDLDDDWLYVHGLAAPADWGWRCGDYFHYALRSALPDYDAYWLIEPDVHFTSSPLTFFARFAGDLTDGLGYRLGRFDQRNRFTAGLGAIEPWQAIFAMTRLTGRAIDHCLAARRAYSATTAPGRFFANDELFVFSTLAAAGLSLGQLEQRAPDWFQGVQFDPNPDLLVDVVDGWNLAGRVFHPVRGRESFKRALAQRIAGQTAAILRARAGLRALSAEDMADIARDAGERIESQLLQIGAAARRRGRGGEA